jgi:hypothetical protein
MSPQAGKCFDGLTTLTDAHDSVQTLAEMQRGLPNFPLLLRVLRNTLLKYCYGYFTD